MSSLMIDIFSFIYGTITLAVFWHKAVISLYGRPQKQVADLYTSTRLEQNRFWDMTVPSPHYRAPLLPGLRHELVTLSTGLKMHYMESLSNTKTRTLIVLIHGFPDSWCIFHPLLSSERLVDLEADIVAIDLPGFGGSDDLQNYGPDAMLNAITETIHLLKQRYLTAEATKCIVVGHDWGGIIAYRLAAETIGLMDRACMINTAYAPLMKANANAVLTLTKPHLLAWRKAPFTIQHLLVAWTAAEPLRAQLLKSCYIFMLNLPLWMLRRNTITIEYLLDLCHTRGNTSITAVPPVLFETSNPSNNPRRDAFAQARASSFGPGHVESAVRGAKYGHSVKVRSRKSDRLPGDWLQRIRLYREGLAADDWQLVPHLQQYALPRSHNRTTFKCPVVELKDAGHWPMLDSEQGMEAMVRTMWWMVRPEYGLDSAFSSWIVTQKNEINTKLYG
ncbi:hypothetical protein LTR78_010208 [Recurvomyces mirabilis]|uniref:AB hydrolase-1 domain-containing protein n=1 Tax=Recurvomyces mirabilis TaxID=574656 RepID=A0AAE0TQF9_9PEZI|nr:hypothetical protein LTR78_010208 [Recurvomyces mirabilis]KAK5149674.1 hypothetical protein LTS14_010735 [Recurvomyces mirabilis]